jgi:hypothetical protein
MDLLILARFQKLTIQSTV